MPTFWVEHLGVALGDLCLLWHARLDQKVAAIVANTCPTAEPLGGISIAAAKRLAGKNVSSRKGGEFPASGTIHCYIFTGGGAERPLLAGSGIVWFGAKSDRADVRHALIATLAGVRWLRRGAGHSPRKRLTSSDG
jgi:hypothetical protein